MSPGRADDEDTVAAPSGDPQGSPGDSHLDSGVKRKFDDVKRRAAGLESTLDAHIEAAERQAEQRAAVILAQAEREAQEVREESQAQLDAAREQVEDLVRLRQALFASFRDTLKDFEGAIARAEEDRSFAEAAAAVDTEDDGESPAEVPPETDGAPSSPAGEPSPQQPGAPVVEVRVEPLRNLRAARAVEQAFETLPVGQGVHLRSFEGNTALLEAAGVDVNLLLGSMRAHFPVPFILRDAGPGRLVVQVGEASGRDRA